MTLLLEVSNAFPGLLLSSALRCLLLALLCGGALWLIRVGNAALQSAAWRLVLVAMLILPIVSVVVPVITVPTAFVPHVTTDLLPRVGIAWPTDFPGRNPRQVIRFSGARAEYSKTADKAGRPDANASRWSLVALIFYLLVAGIMIGRIALGCLLLRRAVQSMKRVNEPRLLESLNRECAKLGLLTFPEVRAADNVNVPVTLGWKDPLILLPSDWSGWPTGKLDLVLAHELSHIQRHDFLFRILSKVNKSIYWFHPVSWWVDRRLAELGEQVSDDAALGVCAGRREQYARILGDFADLTDHLQSQFRLGIAMSASALGMRRIKRILDERRTLCGRLNFRQKFLVFAIGAPVLVLLAAAQTADRSPALASPQVGPAPVTKQIVLTGRPRRVLSPMFSHTYTEALQGIPELESSDVTRLEHRLHENPRDFAARLKLIAYCMRGDRAGLPESRRERTELVLWLVNNQPDSEILGSGYGVLSPDDLSPDQLDHAKRLWELASAQGQTNGAVFWNAANFYQQLDQPLYVASLERAVALSPDNQYYAQPLGLLYAAAVLTVNPQSTYTDLSGTNPGFTQRARRILDTTQNPYILEPAVKFLQSEYNRSLMMAKENAVVGALAGQYFQRAKMLDPDLDEAWIYQQIDPKMIGMFAPGARPTDDGQAEFTAALKQIRRLPPDAFPNLPPAISATLQRRGCAVPQPTFGVEVSDIQPRNVVEGEFFEKGKKSWAVLCSANESSSILVFRDALDGRPEEMEAAKDENYLQGAGDGRIAYSHEIRPVGRKDIVGMARGNGGPEPPPIDHQGIDDEFLGKASTIFYWYRGEWKKLAGSD